MKHSEPPHKFVPSGEETRRGFRLWFGREFKEMIERGIDTYLWDDQTAEAKAYEAADIMLRPILTTDPPTVHITVHNGICTTMLYWPESKVEN